MSIKGLADKLTALMPKLRPVEQQIAIELYRALAEGQPVSLAQIAETLDLPERQVRETLSRWPGVFYNDTEAVVGFWGLALSEMPHSLLVNGHALYTWCAWDSLFIPEILGKTARIVSADPVTGERVSLTVGSHGLEQLRPAETVLSFLAPIAAFDADVIQNFCHFVHFFASPGSGNRWSATQKGILLLSADEGYELGRLTNALNFGEALRRPNALVN